MSFVEKRLSELVDGPDLPLPGQGNTRQRWRMLAEVAAEDLSLVKLYEGHTDALAIMAELGHDAGPSRQIWGTWAAEPPQARLQLRRHGDRVLLSGRKSWCSGAHVANQALVTAWDEQGRQCLAAVALDGPGVQVTDDGWAAVGMALADSPDVLFTDAVADQVGAPDGYVQRPGFWHGGCGIAACWYGGCLPLADLLVAAVGRKDDPHLAAHLGAVDVALSSLRALLVAAAGWIDEHPDGDASALALRVRAAADGTAREVLDRVGRAVGAGPLCRDPQVARRFADLPVFIRQTHAERDLAELGRTIAASGQDWQL